MWYGVSKILQEGKPFQINIVFSEEHYIQGYSTTYVVWSYKDSTRR